MAENNDNIRMKLTSVNEVSFMMSPGKVGDNVNPDAIQIGFSTQIQPDVENDIFNMIFGTRYELDGDVVLETIYKFEFEVKDLRQFIVNNNQNITVKHIMPHLLNVAVGTMRRCKSIEFKSIYSKVDLRTRPGSRVRVRPSLYDGKFYFSSEARYAFSEASSFTLGVWVNAPSTMK